MDTEMIHEEIKGGGNSEFNTDFGDFNQNDDEFDDFENAVNESEHEFGDFGAPVFEPVTIVESIEPVGVSERNEHVIKGDTAEEERIQLLLSTFIKSNTLFDLFDDFKTYFGIVDPPKSLLDSCFPLFISESPLELNQELDSIAWKRFQTENIYTQQPFCWRQSAIRNDFISSLHVPEQLGNTKSKSTQSMNDSKTQLKQPSNVDTREVDLEHAKKLVDVPVDDIKKKSVSELKEFIADVQSSIQKLQEQVNFWLDGKEQLMMDAEMNNKMIASLVTYAQQQQVAGTKAIAKKKTPKK